MKKKSESVKYVLKKTPPHSLVQKYPPTSIKQTLPKCLTMVVINFILLNVTLIVVLLLFYAVLNMKGNNVLYISYCLLFYNGFLLLNCSINAPAFLNFFLAYLVFSQCNKSDTLR